jgi:hypothetical protein
MHDDPMRQVAKVIGQLVDDPACRRLIFHPCFFLEVTSGIKGRMVIRIRNRLPMCRSATEIIDQSERKSMRFAHLDRRGFQA